MTQSGIQKPLGAMLLASGVTLAIVVLGSEAIRVLKDTSFTHSPAAETASASSTLANSQYQSQPWPSQPTRPAPSWNDRPQQTYADTLGYARQVSFDAESNLAAESYSPRSDRRPSNAQTYESTNYPAIKYSHLPRHDQPQANSSQQVVPPRATPSYPPSQRLVRDPNPTATSIAPEPAAWPKEPVLADRPSSDAPNHVEFAQDSTQEESRETFSVLQTSFETRILKPNSRLSAPHLTSQIRIGKEGLQTPHSEIPNTSPAEQDPEPTALPRPALRSARPQALPRLRVNPQVEVRAQKRIQYGESLSRRRSFYAAREEFILALLLISNSHDANAHANRLAEALTALDEVNDFVSMRSSTGHDQRFQQTVLSHKTPLLAGSDLTMTSPMKAADLYCGFAQSQIEQAIGFSTAGSEALHALGKLETMAASTNSQGASTSQTKALVFFRAALSVNPANTHCANDLGVLLFNMGRLNEAEETLRLSLGHAQSRVGWSNLALVHKQQASTATSADQRNRQLQLTKLAEHEAQKFQNDPRDHGLADDQWATTSDFQNKAAFPDTVVQRASGIADERAQPQSGRVKAVSFLQKVTGWN